MQWRSPLRRPPSLQDGPLGAYLISCGVSSGGNWAQTAILGTFSASIMPTWQGKINVLGLILLIELTMYVITAGRGGILADSLPRWMICIVGWAVIGLISLALFFLVDNHVFDPLDPTEKIRVIIAISFSSQVVKGLISPAHAAYDQDLATKRVQESLNFRWYTIKQIIREQYIREWRIYSKINERAYKSYFRWLSRYNLSGGLIGTGCAGIFHATGKYALGFLFDAISFLFPISVLIFLQMTGRGPEAIKKDPEMKANWRTEWSFSLLREKLRKDRETRLTFVAGMVIWALLTGAPLTNLLIAIQVFHNEKVYTSITACSIVGLFVSNLISAMVDDRKGKVKQEAKVYSHSWLAALAQWVSSVRTSVKTRHSLARLLRLLNRLWKGVKRHSIPVALVLCSGSMLLYSLGIWLWLSLLAYGVQAIPRRYINIEALLCANYDDRREIRGRLNAQIQRAQTLALGFGVGAGWLAVSIDLWIATVGFSLLALCLSCALLYLSHRWVPPSPSLESISSE